MPVGSGNSRIQPQGDLNEAVNGGNVNVVDYRCPLGSDVGSWNGFVLHHWWIHPHPACARRDLCSDTVDRRTKSRMSRPMR